MKKNIIRLLCFFIPLAQVRHRILKKYGIYRKIRNIIVIENGKERAIKQDELSGIYHSGQGKNNLIKVELPQSENLNIHIHFEKSDNNTIIIHKNCSGHYSIACYDFNNYFELGENTTSCSIAISLIGNTLKIGNDCMLSNNIHVWGDGHSVLDLKTNKVLNKPTSPIIIGNHVWVGERVTLTKGAQIPDDCIIGIASVVTKKFTQKHSVIAGSPAQVRKTGITWHGYSPLTYEEKTHEGIE